jgi:hypothetical protein
MQKIFPLKKMSKISILFFAAIIFFGEQSISQTISVSDKEILRKKEDSLQKFALAIILDSLTANRMRADSQFVRTLVRSLQVKNSFYYPFDSVQGVSKLYSPDSTFRLFTWNIVFDDYYSRQRGAIQIRTNDGSLKLIPLRDYSEFTENAMDSVRDKEHWIGAVYYDIIKTTFGNKNYYTLIGFDRNSVLSNKKWLEVLTFNEKDQPVFGGNFFSYEKDSVKKPTTYRFSMEYKKEARAVLIYDPEAKLIIVDHLISETDEPENKWTYVPDGDYEAFKWQNGKWLHIDKLYNYKLQDGQVPIGDPLLDPKGNIDEKKLQEKSDKNQGKKNKKQDKDDNDN